MNILDSDRLLNYPEKAPWDSLDSRYLAEAGMRIARKITLDLQTPWPEKRLYTPGLREALLTLAQVQVDLGDE